MTEEIWNPVLMSHTTIILPWPPNELSPNFRKGWGAKHSPKVKYRGDCFLLASACCMKYSRTVNIPLSITFHPKTAKAPDLDNCLSWIKHGLDSVAKAFGINDKQFRPITIDLGEPVKGGKVVLNFAPEVRG